MNTYRIEHRGSKARNILSCFLLASLLTTCASSFPMRTPPPTFLPDSQAGAEAHTPVILQVVERTETQNGWLTINKDISFTDQQGDAVTVVHKLISTDPAGVYISSWDDVAVTASAQEQKIKGMVTSPVGCPRLLSPLSLTVEARIRDAANNLSEPVTLTFACPTNLPNSLPSFIFALVFGLGLLAGFWLFFRKRLSEGKPAILSILLLVCSLLPINFIGSILHEGGHALANLILGGTVWSFYVHPFTFLGFVRPIADAYNVWFHALGYITLLLVSFVIFCLFWKRRSVTNLPFVMLFPLVSITQGIEMLILNGDTANILQITELPATVFIGLGLVLVCSGIFFLLVLFPLLGLAPEDRKSLLVVPAVFFLQGVLGLLVAHLFVPASSVDLRYLEGAGIIESANTLVIVLPIIAGLLAVIYVTLFRKIYSKLPAWLRTETANLDWKDLRLPAVLAVVCILVGLFIIA